LGRGLRFGALSVGLGLRAIPNRIRHFFTPRHRKEELKLRQREKMAQRAVESMGQMKGVLMKLGQILSFMDEALPPGMAEALRPLQRSAPPMPFEAVEAAIEVELGMPWQRAFASLEPEPLAAASIGQVHRAVLADGREVAVKVQYPGVATAIRADLANADTLSAMIGALTPTLDAAALARELRERLLEELDYRVEAENQQRFIELFESDEDVSIPAIIPELCSERLLVSELVRGSTFYEFCESASEPARQRAGLALHRFVFDSLWLHQIFNADPHPGNFLFDVEGRIICLDFGSVKHFSADFITSMKALTRAYLDGDREDYYRGACELGFILPGQEKRVSPEWLWEFVGWFHEPIAEDREYQFTPEYSRRAFAQVFGDNMRKVNMPADYLMLNRITFGVNSLLSKLGARNNWHRQALRYLEHDGAR
jgi:predicted unusual protein kinase regulating ubiquinone biosynthesis (AarF/ABC1/UbiB family)